MVKLQCEIYENGRRGLFVQLFLPWLVDSHGKQCCCIMALKQVSMVAMVTGFVPCKVCSEAEEITEHQE
jgi:hypothetical protein